MKREADILRRIMGSLPPDQEGTMKTASSQIDDLVREALADLEKTAEDESSNLPPEFIEEKKMEDDKGGPVEDKANEKAKEKAKEAEVISEKEAYAKIGAAYLAEKTASEETSEELPKEEDKKKEPPKEVSEEVPEEFSEEEVKKEAAEIRTTIDAFMQKVSAAAMADEIAKIAYMEMSGLPFHEYLEKSAAGLISRFAKGMGHLGGAFTGGTKIPGKDTLGGLLNVGKGRGLLQGSNAKEIIDDSRLALLGTVGGLGAAGVAGAAIS